MMAQLRTFVVNASAPCTFIKSINSSRDLTFFWLSELLLLWELYALPWNCTLSFGCYSYCLYIYTCLCGITCWMNSSVHFTLQLMFFCLSVVMPLENRRLKKEVLHLMLNAQTYPGGRDIYCYWVLGCLLLWAPWSFMEDSRKKASSFFCVCFSDLLKVTTYAQFILNLSWDRYLRLFSKLFIKWVYVLCYLHVTLSTIHHVGLYLLCSSETGGLAANFSIQEIRQYPVH